jgi:hypothetical protein
MNFSTLFSYLSTFITVWLTDVIKTDNRILDNTLVGLISFLILESITWFKNNWIQFYNCIIYHSYKMDKNIFELCKAPYIYPTYEKEDEFFQKFTIISITDLQKINIDYNEIIDNIIKKSGRNPLVINKKIIESGYGYKVSSKLPIGIYLIGFDYKGNPIFYENFTELFVLVKFCSKIKENIYNQVQKEFNQMKINPTNEKNILIPKILQRNRDRYDSSQGKMLNLSFDKLPISKRKTFNSLFYTQKSELITFLDKFKKGELYPEHVPMDNKLGILLYGPPGTGKTGTISAIANYLDRNVIVINFTNIYSIEEMDLILNPSSYNENIFVFDEFDCILDVLGKNNEQKEEKDWGSMLMFADGDDKKKIIDNMINSKKKSKINLAYLLQKLDGLESTPNRLIIATTNNPDKINPALLRPGRFDIKLCLGNCTTDMYGKILEYYYKDEKDVYKRVVKKRIPEYKYSPLEIMNKAMQYDKLNILLENL